MRAEFASKVCTYAKKYGCIPIWWDNGATGTYGFGLFNRSTGTVTQPKIINAITAVYPSSGNTSGSTSSIDTSKTYMLKNVNSGLYMDVCGAKAVNGTNVIQYSASKAKANNTWKFVPDGKGYYYIYSCLGDGRTFLLDVSCNSSANGTNIGIYKNTNCSAQLYKLVKILTEATAFIQSLPAVRVLSRLLMQTAAIRAMYSNGFTTDITVRNGI